MQALSFNDMMTWRKRENPPFMLMTRSRRWSPEDDAQLRELFLAGLSPMRMAIRLKRTQRAVEVRIAALKLRHPQPVNVGHTRVVTPK